MDISLIKSCSFSGVAITVVAFLLIPHADPLTRCINALFVAGIIFMVIGIFRLTRHLHMYDLFLYSSKKFAQVLKTKHYIKGEDPLGNYHDYLQTTSYNRPFAEFLTVGGGFVGLSFLLILFV